MEFRVGPGEWHPRWEATTSSGQRTHRLEVSASASPTSRARETETKERHPAPAGRPSEGGRVGLQGAVQGAPTRRQGRPHLQGLRPHEAGAPPQPPPQPSLLACEGSGRFIEGSNSRSRKHVLCPSSQELILGNASPWSTSAAHGLGCSLCGWAAFLVATIPPPLPLGSPPHWQSLVCRAWATTCKPLGCWTEGWSRRTCRSTTRSSSPSCEVPPPPPPPPPSTFSARPKPMASCFGRQALWRARGDGFCQPLSSQAKYWEGLVVAFCLLAQSY